MPFSRRNAPFLLFTLFLLIGLAMCSPLPQGAEVFVTVTSTVQALRPTSTSISAIIGSSTTITSTPSSQPTTVVYESQTFGTIRFRSEPKGRGTIGIIVSCTATYIFCVWTTLHPNVNETRNRMFRLWYKFVITLIAIIAPVAVMIYAFAEYREAKRLVSEWDKHFKARKTGDGNTEESRTADSTAQTPKGNNQTIPDPPPVNTEAIGTAVSNTAVRKPGDNKTIDDDEPSYVPLQLSTAFFILMGGFVDDKAEPHAQPDAEETVTPKRSAEQSQDSHTSVSEKDFQPILYTKGFEKYLKEGRIDMETSFDQEQIVDKGKGNLIAKIFAGGQALWLILQSIARGASNLPLTALEIHVLIQVLCTLIIYFCWFRKPLDVGVPLEIRLNSKHLPPQAQYTGQGSDKANEASLSDLELSGRPGTDVPQFPEPTLNPAPAHQTTFDFRAGRGIFDFKKFDPVLPRKVQKPQAAPLPVLAKALLDVVVHARPHRSFLELEEQNEKVSPRRKYDRRRENPSNRTSAMVATQGVLVVLFAALHLGAWFTQFPSETEKWLWRGACFSMIIFPMWAAAVLVNHAYDFILYDLLWVAHLKRRGVFELPAWLTRKFHKRIVELSQVETPSARRTSRRKVIKHYILLYSCLTSVFIYVIAALFIALESYIAIRALPEEAFQSPRWADIVPHL